LASFPSASRPSRSRAYAAAFYFYYFGTNPYVGILIGIAAGIVMSLAVGPMFVRLRSDYFALVNLALAVIVFYLMQKVLADITHGDNGLWFLTNLSPTPVLDLTRPDQFFIFAFLVGFVVWAFYKYLDTRFTAPVSGPRSTTIC
jgi:branched-chain amino acid transport system permease protein